MIAVDLTHDEWLLIMYGLADLESGASNGIAAQVWRERRIDWRATADKLMNALRGEVPKCDEPR